jgi:hypothetical protein
LHFNLFYADPGFDHPEDVHTLIGAELSFYLLHPIRYFDSGRVPTLQETELGVILGRHTASRVAIQRSSVIMFKIGRKQFRCTGTMFLDD